jgi:hypothetical protein
VAALVPFADMLVAQLATLHARYVALLERMEIRNVDPNRGGGGSVAFIGFASWGWTPNPDLVNDRTRLHSGLDEWVSLFRLIHRDALPETAKRIESAESLLRRWLAQEGSDHSVPSNIADAISKVRTTFDELRTLIAQVAVGTGGYLVVPDTNALLREPDVASYGTALGTDEYCVVMVPPVLAELDEQKDRGRTEEVRKAANTAIRRLKGLRDRGDARQGVRVQGRTTLRFEHRDVRPPEILEWLDTSVPDDRLLAAALDLQGRMPTSSVVLVTSDINLQTKASVAALPFLDI